MNEANSFALALLVILLFACSFVGLLVSLPMLIVSALRMRSHIRPEYDSFRRLWFNKFNVIFFSYQLDEIGKDARAETMRWLKSAVISGVLGSVAFLIVTVSSKQIT